MQGRGSIRDFNFEGVYVKELNIERMLIQGINTSDFDYNLNGHLNLKGQGIMIGRLEAESGIVNAILEPGKAVINNARFILPQQISLTTSGSWELSKVYKESYLDRTRLTTLGGVLTSNRLIHLSFTDTGIDIKSLVFDYAKNTGIKQYGSINAKGFFTYSGDIERIVVNGKRFNLGEFASILYPNQRMSGDADFNMVMKGSFSDPIIEGKVLLGRFIYYPGYKPAIGLTVNLNKYKRDEEEGDPFAQREIKPAVVQSDSGFVVLNYRNGALNIEEAKVFQNEIPSTIKGIIPLGKTLSDKEIRLAFDINGIDSDLLGLFTDIISLSKGDISFKGNIRGNLNKPEIDGIMDIKNGQVIFVPTGNVFTDVKACLAFVSDRILFAGEPYYIEAGTPEGGNVYINGRLDITGFKLNSVLAKIEATNVLFDAVPDIIMKGDATLFVYGPPDHIIVKGDVELDEGLITIPFNQEDYNRTFPSSGDIQYDLKIRGENNIWLRNPSINAELSVDMGFRWWKKDIIFIGSLDALRGEYYLLGNELRIDKGNLTFNNNPEFNPRLNFIASTTIRGSIREEDTVIKAVLTGTLRKSELDLHAYDYLDLPKDYNQADILSMLALGMTWADIEKSKATGLMRNQGLTTALTSMSVLMTRGWGKNIGLSTFYIKTDLGTSENKVLELTAGRYMLRNLYLSYTQDLVHGREQTILLEYLLNKIHSLQIDTEYDRDLKERQFNLDWKLLFKF